MRFLSKALLIAFGVLIPALSARKILIKDSSATFAGPEFHTLDAADVSKVGSDLSRHLEGLGFKAADSPSAMDSWAGVHGQGSTRSWVVRREPGRRVIWVAVDRDATRVATSVKWENRGMDGSRIATENEAYRFALKLDDWFRGRSEVNRLSVELIEKKKDWFIERLEQNHGR